MKIRHSNPGKMCFGRPEKFSQFSGGELLCDMLQADLLWLVLARFTVAGDAVKALEQRLMLTRLYWRSTVISEVLRFCLYTRLANGDFTTNCERAQVCSDGFGVVFRLGSM